MKKKVLSVVTWPVRAIKRISKSKKPRIGKSKKPGSPSLAKPAPKARARRLPKLPRLSRPPKLPKVQGRPRIALFVALGIIVVIAVLALRPSADDNEAVADTLDSYAEATRGKDYQKLCDELFASALVERIRSAGLPCEVAVRTGLEDRQNPSLTVQQVEVSGEQALARVRSTAAGEVPSVDTIRLVKEDDGWRIASLAGGANSAAGQP